jgi:hypothetical protein
MDHEGNDPLSTYSTLLLIAETTNASKKVLELLPLTGTARCASRGLFRESGAARLLI